MLHLSSMRAMGALVLALLVTACAPAGPTPNPPASPTPTPPPGSVIVSIRVIDEQFRILLTDPADVAIAWEHAAGREAPRIPNGRVVYGDPGVNLGWSWHLDPDDFEWADMAAEVCDGRPSDVEDRVITSDRYCTWAAEVVEVVPA